MTLINDESQFKEVYSRLIEPQLNEIEAERKKALYYLILSLVLICPVGAFSLYTEIIEANRFFFNYDIPIFYLILYGSFILGMYFLMAKFFTLYFKYRVNYKSKIISIIFKAIAPSLKYDAHGAVPVQIFKNSGLFLHSPDRYVGDDYLSGKINKTKIDFSDVLVEYKKEIVRPGKKKETRWYSLFYGHFFSADFNKKITGKTLVFPDRAEKWLGKYAHFFQNISKPSEHLVKLEDPRFEKEFVVYASDQIEARYCLSPQVMEGLTHLKQHLKKLFFVSFYGTRIHIIIPGVDNFEPPLLRKSMTYDKVFQFWRLTVLLTSIVDLVDLNTRIWTKK